MVPTGAVCAQSVGSFAEAPSNRGLPGASTSTTRMPSALRKRADRCRLQEHEAVCTFGTGVK